MSGDDYTAYQEDEVLLQDGFQYTIDSIEETRVETTNQKLLIVKIIYPVVNSDEIESTLD